MLLLLACAARPGDSAGVETGVRDSVAGDSGDSGRLGDSGDSGDSGRGGDSGDSGDSGWDSGATADAWSVRIEPGTWEIGSPEEEVGRTADETRHAVTLTYAWRIDRTEVTLAAFEEGLGYVPNGDSSGGEDGPVRWADWHEAAAFANARSAAEGLEACYACEGSGDAVSCDGGAPTCAGWRLPTEAEWEIAARAGESAAFPSGGSLEAGQESECEAAVVLDDGSTLGDFAWYCGNSEDRVHPVGSLAPNEWGLHDVVGNVYEWVGDGFASFDEEDAVDPVGDPAAVQKVHKGGGWGTTPANARPANRAPTDPTFTSGGLGFRLARTLPE